MEIDLLYGILSVGGMECFSLLNSQRSALTESHESHNKNSNPADDSDPSGYDSENEWNCSVDSIIASSFKRQIFMQIIHEVKHSTTCDARL